MALYKLCFLHVVTYLNLGLLSGQCKGAPWVLDLM